METLATLIKTARLRRGMRGMDLAYAIGKDPGYVTRIEHGTLKEIPSPEIVKALSAALEIPEPDIVEAIGYTPRNAATPATPLHAINEPRPSYAAADAFIATLTPEQRQLLRDLLDAADAVTHIDDARPKPAPDAARKIP